MMDTASTRKAFAEPAGAEAFKVLTQSELDARFTVLAKQWPYVFLQDKTTGQKAICLNDGKGHYYDTEMVGTIRGRRGNL